MPSNDGTAAEEAFETLIAADVLYRFPDQKMLRGLNNGRAVGAFRQPSDYLVTKARETWYCEVKSTQSATSFSFADIQPSQKAMALKQARVGGRYDFIIFSFGLGEWFLMPCQQFATAIEGGAKSIKFTELQEWI
jgi:penicillin-binding protein-related factor A (putative recombinase)